MTDHTEQYTSKFEAQQEAESVESQAAIDALTDKDRELLGQILNDDNSTSGKLFLECLIEHDEMKARMAKIDALAAKLTAIIGDFGYEHALSVGVDNVSD